MSAVVVRPSAERVVTPRFVTLIASALFFFFAYGMTVPILSPFVKDELGGTNLAVGVVIGAVALSAICIRPWLAPRTITWGCPRLILISLLAGGLAFVAYGFAQNTLQLGALRLVTGGAQATLLIAAITMVTNSVSPARRAEAISYFSVAPYIGNGLGPVFGQWAFDAWGFDHAFVASGVVGLLGVAPVVFLRDARRDAEVPEVKRRAFHRGAVWPGAVLALGIVGAIAMSAFIPLFVADLGAGGSQWIFLAYAVVVLLVRTLGGRLPGRIGSARTGIVSTVMIVVGMGGFALTPSVSGIYVALVPLGIGMALQYPGLLALAVNRVSDEDRPAAISTFTMFFDIAAGVGGLLIGSVAAVGGYRSAFGAAAVCSCIGLVLLWTLVLNRSMDEPAAG
jgi:predicted MFS family arabinose efflux permease